VSWDLEVLTKSAVSSEAGARGARERGYVVVSPREFSRTRSGRETSITIDGPTRLDAEDLDEYELSSPLGVRQVYQVCVHGWFVDRDLAAARHIARWPR